MNLERIREYVEGIAQSWRHDCIINGHSISYGYNPHEDTKVWSAPPLVSDMRESKGTQEFLNDFYFSPSTDVEVFSVWDFVMAHMKENVGKGGSGNLGPVHRVMKTVFPDYAFGMGNNHVFSSSIQFLKLASLTKGRKLTLTRTSCLLDIGGKRIGLDRTGVFGADHQFRTRLRLDSMMIPLHSFSTGHTRRPRNLKLGGAYQLLVKTLPKRLKEIELVFSVAIFSDREIETVIADQFDIFIIGEKSTPSPSVVFEECKLLIERSASNPLKVLYQKLRTLCTAKEFIQGFGSPYQRMGKTYSPEARLRHRAALQALIDGRPIKVSKEKSSKDVLLNHLFNF